MASVAVELSDRDEFCVVPVYTTSDAEIASFTVGFRLPIEPMASVAVAVSATTGFRTAKLEMASVAVAVSEVAE